jgi:hypothetical protein
VSAGEVRLEGSDGSELVELSGACVRVAGRRRRGVAGGSLVRFLGVDGDSGYDLGELRADLARSVFLLGGSDGQALFDGRPE